MGVSIFASGSMPDACAYGHPWAPEDGSVNVSWVTCLCAGGTGHHRVRCQAPGCTSVWYDPPHDPEVRSAGYPPCVNG